MKVSADWLEASGAAYSAGTGEAGYVHLKHYTAAYCEWGAGPPLLLVPGLAGGFELLGPLARLLAQHYRVISYQLRGEDDAFALRRRFGLDDLVEDLQEFLAWYGLEAPPMMGVSFGGVLALEYALRRPHGLSSLIVQGAGARFERGLLQQVAGAVLSRYPLPPDNPFVNQFFNLFHGGKPDSASMARFVVERCWETDQGVMARRLAMLESFDVSDRLWRLESPTLVLGGTRDVVVPADRQKALASSIAGARFESIEGAGHVGFLTHSADVARSVERLCRGGRPSLA
jgi:pimeloyl-ACP methyl ester carboxylesterase